MGLLLVGAALCPANEPVDFAHDVVPVLKRHCAECHMGEAKKGGFSMNTRESILEGSENGAVVTPGKGAESYFIEVMRTDDDSILMPSKGDRVPEAAIETLVRWIDQQMPWEPGFTFGKEAWEPPLAPREVSLPEPIAGREHPIDRLLDHYLAEAGQSPTGQIDDAVFQRRLFLDVLGVLPTPEERSTFLTDPAPDKRDLLVDAVLARDVDYAEHWLTFWNDLLRNDYAGTGFIDGGRKQITGWLYRALIDNVPYDRFVRDLVAPQPGAEGFIGGIKWRGRVNASQTREIQFAQNLGQVFLGINMKCASCHDSFIDRWKLDDAYQLAAIFATEPIEIHRCDKATGKMAKAGWIFPELGDVNPEAPQPERLLQLAGLMTHRENGRFTRTLVNRVWHRLMGRGIVHPVDAMHTEPWSEDLLDWLAEDFVAQDYDLRRLIRRIVTSRAYQAPMAPSPDESAAEAYVYRGPIARRLTAEQFIDAVWQLTGTAPAAPAVDVMRMKIKPSDFPETEVTGQWIWADREGVPAAGETISLRRTVKLAKHPTRAFAVVSADNAYTLYVNGQKLQADGDWSTVETVNLKPALKIGENEILVVARNAGSGPNIAGAFVEARIEEGDSVRIVASDTAWQWSAVVPNRKGKFGKPVTDWKPVKLVSGPWGERVGPQARAGLASAEATTPRRVRASLVKSDLLMRSLGRPNREQVVTVRPEQLSTLQAIDLANGEILAGLLNRGGTHRLQQAGDGSSADSVIERIFLEALNRPPTTAEKTVLRPVVGEQPTAQGMEDLLWAVTMLPEFQLVR